jgi:hypothetical protein
MPFPSYSDIPPSDSFTGGHPSDGGWEDEDQRDTEGPAASRTTRKRDRRLSSLGGTDAKRIRPTTNRPVRRLLGFAESEDGPTAELRRLIAEFPSVGR